MTIEKARRTPDIIQAIPANGNGLQSRRAAIPKSFYQKSSIPATSSTSSQPELNHVGNGKDPVPVDPKTNEIPSKRGTKDKEPARQAKIATRTSPARATPTAHRNFFALQEAFAEIHIGDLSDTYDFLSSRWGIQPFKSDFRGFIFSDTNLGARIFGNWDNNRWQYNLVYFNQREKDTYSDLNTFESRHQNIIDRQCLSAGRSSGKAIPRS